MPRIGSADVYARIKQEDVKVDIEPAALREIGRKAVKKLTGKPSVMAVTCAVSGDPFLDREDYAATCCAIQNIMLAAWEDGIGMQWSTSALIEDAEALSVLGVDPRVNGWSACCTPASPSGCRSPSASRPPRLPPGWPEARAAARRSRRRRTRRCLSVATHRGGRYWHRTGARIAERCGHRIRWGHGRACRACR